MRCTSSWFFSLRIWIFTFFKEDLAAAVYLRDDRSLSLVAVGSRDLIEINSNLKIIFLPDGISSWRWISSVRCREWKSVGIVKRRQEWIGAWTFRVKKRKRKTGRKITSEFLDLGSTLLNPRRPESWENVNKHNYRMYKTSFIFNLCRRAA